MPADKKYEATNTTPVLFTVHCVERAVRDGASTRTASRQTEYSKPGVEEFGS
jgi:hypothetical protein